MPMPRKSRPTEAALITEKPNWRTGEGYPDHGDKTRLWAWEFLRRNPNYRRDWERIVSIAERLREKYSSPEFELNKQLPHPLPLPPMLIMERAWSHEEETATAYDPPRLDGETMAQWLKRVGRGNCTSIERFLARQYGLRMMNDPAANRFLWVGGGWETPGVSQPGRYRDNDEFRWFHYVERLAELLDKPGQPEQTLANGREFVAGLRRLMETRKAEMFENSDPQSKRAHGKLVLEFDLSFPYVSQLEKAADQIQFEQEKFIESGGKVWDGRKDKTRNLYCKYLRVLDALDEIDDERETAKVIAGIMKAQYADKETAITGASAWLEAAKALRDGGYKKLVAIDNSWPSRHKISKKKEVKKK
jgi:hypothetical protein